MGISGGRQPAGAIRFSPLPFVVHLVLVLCLCLISTVVQAQLPPACPALKVSLKTNSRAADAKPLRPGHDSLGVMVTVTNVGAAPLEGVGLRVTIPLQIRYSSVKISPSIKYGGSNNPLFQAPQVYWPNFALPVGKTRGRKFLLKGPVSHCQQSGAFTVQAAAYILGRNCSTSAVLPVQVLIVW